MSFADKSKKYLDDTFRLFSESADCAIYGAGGTGEMVLEYCKEFGKEVLYFIDDYKSGEIEGIPVVKASDRSKYKEPDIVIFACGSVHSFMNMLPKRIKSEARSIFYINPPAIGEIVYFMDKPTIDIFFGFCRKEERGRVEREFYESECIFLPVLNGDMTSFNEYKKQFSRFSNTLYRTAFSLMDFIAGRGK
jgi:hypothetical protein